MAVNQDFFDQYVERRGTRSSKWDGCNEKFGVDPSVEMIPMWIADMDFRCHPKIVEAVTKKAREGIYGYCVKPESFYQAIMDWVERRYRWKTEKEWIIFTPGVIPGFTLAIQAFTEPGDGILVQTPVYYPFMDEIRNNGRKLVENRLVRKENGSYEMDFDDLETKAKDSKTKLLILCNPHNPVGRCWTKDELKTLGEICLRNHVVIISDEIHADLIMDGYTHTAMSSLSEEIRQITVTTCAPSKTFNLAGLQTAYAIIPNPGLRAAFEARINANRIFNMNWFGPVALETAYNECEEYVTELCTYINANKLYFNRYIKENLPQLKVTELEATYLTWVDFRGTGMTVREIESFISQKAHIGVDLGSWFGSGGEGFLRFGIACPRSLLKKALLQLTEAFRNQP